MRQLIFALLFLSLICSSIAVTVCGRCLGRGEVCSGRQGACGENLKCTQSQSNANLCFPVFELGEKCTSVGEFDACETGFFCNRTGSGTCERSVGVPGGTLNDGCEDDRWCIPGLTCQGGLCKLNIERCLINQHCPIGHYCDLTNGCKELQGEGSDCATVGCHPSLFCDTVTDPTNPKCRSSFSFEENQNCSSTSQCKPGLICDCINPPNCVRKCMKPSYFILGGYGAAWGQDCDPLDPTNTGCTCNYDTKIYMYLKEVSRTYLDGCNNVRKELYKCLADKGCTGTGKAAKSCYRTNCYHFENLVRVSCSTTPPSLLPPICSAQGIAAMFMLIAFMLML